MEVRGERRDSSSHLIVLLHPPSCGDPPTRAIKQIALGLNLWPTRPRLNWIRRTGSRRWRCAWSIARKRTFVEIERPKSSSSCCGRDFSRMLRSLRRLHLLSSFRSADQMCDGMPQGRMSKRQVESSRA